MRKYLRMRQRKKESAKIAEERVRILLEKVKADPEGRHSCEYMRLALRLARAGRLKIPELENHCPGCFRYLVPGLNCKVRVVKGRSYAFCRCGKRLSFLSVPANKKE